ncbi:MAG TPA: sigma-70 family RNA polymerase sigma factor [Gemmataceae bacterium]|nr:sigma-70 family RNA polymerase sigma factor [Gemmataceae bacterium]
MLRHDDAGQTDGTLLERFIAQQDEAAFEALVRRHGPMVLGVCRRVLRNEADAEDAFQATFLVLVRRAGSIRPRGMVGNWLYGVAQNTARKAKVMNTRMRAREREAGARPKPEAASQDWQQQQELLDQELQALPDKYRAPIVLCDLEGKSIKEAARHLGCPSATIGTRLARGRSMLARRLARRGLILSGGVIATVLSQNAASAGVSLPLVTSTVKAASLFAAGQAASGVVGAKVAALTEGVLKAMLLTKLKIASALLVLAVAVIGGVTSLTAPTASLAHAAPVPQEKPDPVKLELASLQGTWRRVGGEHCGEKFAAEDLKKAEAVWEIKGEQITWRNVKVKDGFQTALKIDPSKQPKEIDMGPIHINGKLQDNPLGNPLANKGSLGIYELKGDTLRVCYGGGGEDGKQRPKEFKTVRRDLERFPDPHEVIMVFERIKDAAPQAQEKKTLPEFALDLTKIDRTIRKEPAYRGKPRYALLVLGPKAQTRIWLVIDDQTLYVDRNGNGDLTEKGEQVAVTKVDVNQYVEFHAGEIVEADGKTKHSHLFVYQYYARQNDQLVNTINVMDVAGTFGQGTNGENGCSFAATPKEAPVIHINGPLTLRAHSVWAEFPGGRKLKEVPYQLDLGEKVAQLHVQVGTPGLGKGTFAAFATEQGFPADLHPMAEISMPSKADPNKMIKLQFSLKERCCGTQFNGPVQIPEAGGPGKAKVTLSFPDWKEGKVAPAVVELPMMGALAR